MRPDDRPTVNPSMHMQDDQLTDLPTDDKDYFDAMTVRPSSVNCMTLRPADGRPMHVFDRMTTTTDGRPSPVIVELSFRPDDSHLSSAMGRIEEAIMDLRNTI